MLRCPAFLWGGIKPRRHSFDAVARIRDTTQLLLNVYSNEKYIYLHPMKVWNRYSEQMFLPHCLRKDTRECSVVADGVGLSRYYQIQQRAGVLPHHLSALVHNDSVFHGKCIREFEDAEGEIKVPEADK